MKIIIELKEKEKFGFLNLQERNRIEEHTIIQGETCLVDGDVLKINKRVTKFSKNQISEISYPLANIVKYQIEGLI